MKSGVKGFWKKQKNVIRRHKPSSIVNHCPVLFTPSQWESYVRDFQSRVSPSDSEKSFNKIIEEHFDASK